MWTWNSDPFGTDAANPNPAGAGTFAYNLRFPGQLFDGQAGLHQNHFRDFDPAVGGYVESDRIGLRGGVNTYAYAEGDPIGNYDFKGLASSSWAETIGQIQAVGLGNAWQASNDATDAAHAAVDAVNNNEIWGGIEGLHNGPADAFRHCTWSCLMTRSIGIGNAEKVGATHEFYNIRDDLEPPDEFVMDTLNNKVGRCVGKNSKKPCPTACQDKLRAGELRGLWGARIRSPW
jgi:RHS repeat-associated protein